MTVSPWLVLAGVLLGAGQAATLIALHPVGRADRPPETADPVRQPAETSGLIPRQGAST
ncbi:hypothetical protein ACIQC7_35155 [Kitasatospora sp. NPDC088556]|uniref:hypothetical protein n=1 Tax=Kitasatospora sp. NPDC088556 TaxID=3364076 RepID=UPI00380010C4